MRHPISPGTKGALGALGPSTLLAAHETFCVSLGQDGLFSCPRRLATLGSPYTAWGPSTLLATRL